MYSFLAKYFEMWKWNTLSRQWVPYPIVYLLAKHVIVLYLSTSRCNTMLLNCCDQKRLFWQKIYDNRSNRSFYVDKKSQDESRIWRVQNEVSKDKIILGDFSRIFCHLINDFIVNWTFLGGIGWSWLIYGSFWVILTCFGSFWVVPRFSKYDSMILGRLSKTMKIYNSNTRNFFSLLQLPALYYNVIGTIDKRLSSLLMDFVR